MDESCIAEITSMLHEARTSMKSARQAGRTDLALLYAGKASVLYRLLESHGVYLILD